MAYKVWLARVAYRENEDYVVSKAYVVRGDSLVDVVTQVREACPESVVITASGVGPVPGGLEDLSARAVKRDRPLQCKGLKARKERLVNKARWGRLGHPVR